MRHTALPRGGGDAALARLVGHTHAMQLDRSRPLWELWVIEGLSGDRVALYSKVHVAAIDDHTGAELMTALLDIDADGRPAVRAAEPVDGRRRRTRRARRDQPPRRPGPRPAALGGRVPGPPGRAGVARRRRAVAGSA